jgi:hypothetical protein
MTLTGMVEAGLHLTLMNGKANVIGEYLSMGTYL